MNIPRAVFMALATLTTASCSEKSAPDREGATSATPHESRQGTPAEVAKRGEQPDQRNIGQDCVALVRSTKAVPARTRSADCPECPAAGTDVLTFRHATTDSVTCSGDACTVVVTIHADFNPGSGETMAGGLTAWIPVEQRTAYLSGQTPSGEQSYRVQITYHRRDGLWQAVEFDRAPVK